MKLRDERNQVRNLIRNYSEWTKGASPKFVSNKQRQISALDPETATASDIREITGTTLVQEECCGECGLESWQVVEMGTAPESPGDTFCICADCLHKALKLVKV